MGVSVAGGVSHNIGQLLVAMLDCGKSEPSVLSPGASGGGGGDGFLIGIVSSQVLNRIGMVFHQ